MISYNMIIAFFFKYLYIICGVIILIIIILLTSILIKQNSIIHNIHSRNNYTDKIAQSFHIPAVAGQWGEMQLRRLAELAGMLPYCEFILQNEIKEGRPDMTVMLPNKCTVYIDAKAPMSAYLKSIEDSSNANKWIKENTKAIKNHINILSKREYWKTTNGPELTVMFIPSEVIWLTALHQDSTLLEYAAVHNIIVTTPMTLIGLLKTIAYGWQNMAFTADINKTVNILNELKNNTTEIQNIIETCIQINNKQKNKLSDIIKILSKIHNNEL